MLLLKRMRMRSSVFLSLLLIVATGSGLLVGITGMLNAAEADGVRAQLAHRVGADVSFELSLGSDSDGAAQDARVRALLERTFSDGRRIFDIDVTRTIVSDSPVALSTGVKAFVASVPEIETHASLADGRWPDGANEASVQADAADALGIAPGDALSVGDASVVVSGTWRVTDPLDPRWVSDSLFLDGSSGVILGPIVLSEDEIASVGAITNTRWVIEPQLETLQSGDLDVYLRGWSALDDALRADGGLNINSLHRGGRLAAVAADVQATVSGLHAVAPVAILMIAALTILALVELARLLSVVRSGEYLLFWSRGDTVRALTTVAAIEAGAVALVGSVIGTTAARLIVAQPIGSLGVVEWLIPLAAVVVAALVFGARALADSRGVARSGTPEENERAAGISGIAAPALLGVGGAISIWQLLLNGSPLSPTRDGSLQVDPIAVLAPALGVIALISIAGAVLPLPGRILDSAAARSTGRALVVRTLTRRTRLFSAVFVLFALAAGQLTLASAYAQTWDSAYSSAAALRAGSALTIDGSRTPLTERVLTSVQRADGVDEVAPVYSQPVEVGATAASMFAVAPAALASLGTTAGGLFDTTSAADLIALPPAGPKIPGGARDLAVSATSDSAGPSRLTLVIADDFGVQHEVESAGPYRFALPEGHGDWRILAVIVHLSEEGPTAFAVTSVVADGVVVDIDGGWVAQGFDPLQAAVTTSPTEAGFSDARGLTSVRLSPLFGRSTDAVRPPVLISRELARTARLRVGDTVPLALDVRSDSFACVVAGIVSAIPGAESEPAVLVDVSLIQAIRARFYDQTPTPQAAWIGANGAAASPSTLRDVVPAGIAVKALAADPDRGVLGAASAAMWLGAAGAGVLCFIAVFASISVQIRARRNERLIVRALGVTDREVAADRSAEVVIVATTGVLSGLGAGLIVAQLTISPLARAAVPGSYAAIETVTGFHSLGLAIGLSLFVVGLAISTLSYIQRVIR